MRLQSDVVPDLRPFRPVRQFAKRITKVAQLNYCEHSARINIVHAPTVFKAIFAVVQPLINKRTLAKFRITGADCGFLKVRPMERGGGTGWGHGVGHGVGHGEARLARGWGTDFTWW